MTDISRARLFGKLNPTLFKAVEGATVFCKLRGNPHVELVHWLHQLFQLDDSDLHRLIRHYHLDPARLAADMGSALERLPTGANAIDDLSASLEAAVERGWVYATLLYDRKQVRGAALLVGLLKTPDLRNRLLAISPEFAKFDPDTLAREAPEVVKDSPEAALDASENLAEPAAPGEAAGAISPAALGKGEALARYTVDLTEQARQGKVDPVTGRDVEIRQIVDILMRRRQNNPLLVGEAGVGKTAIVEGFARRLAQGDVPPQLREVSLRVLDLGLLQAGASMKGEFEQRLRAIVDEVEASAQSIILFIDEVHTLVGAGGESGTGDAANLLKPALARGSLRTIGATTWAEYKKYIEKDPALTRRFQAIQVGEPDEARAVTMLRGLVGVLEDHHQVALLDEAVVAAVELSHRYIPARQLPDKAVSLLDTACARVAVSQHATPAQVEDCQRRIETLGTERDIIARELVVGVDVSERQSHCEAAIETERQRLVKLEQRFGRERPLVEAMLALRAELREAEANPGGTQDATEFEADPAKAPIDLPAATARYTALRAELQAMQGELPLILPEVDAGAVAQVVADWTGIPVGRMVRDELDTVLQLAETLQARVIGQEHALERIARRIRTSRARLDDPDKPIGVFLLVGPSGVGKTESALALAEALYGGEHNLITINMSEFQEAHAVSTLKGAPPGYVGYGEGGVLTEAVRRKPYSVVLLDEIEKAHPDVHEIFFQVFDKGWMEDGEGRAIDFRNTIILLTSNVGADIVTSLASDAELLPEPEALADALREPLRKAFPAAFLGRLVTLPYYPLADATLACIVGLQFERIRARLEEQHGIEFAYDQTAVDLVIERCTEVESGGRMIDAILTHTVLPTISGEFLATLRDGRALRRVSVGAAGGDFVYDYGFRDAAPGPGQAVPATALAVGEGA